jgi:hypothetical protein
MVYKKEGGGMRVTEIKHNEVLKGLAPDTLTLVLVAGSNAMLGRCVSFALAPLQVVLLGVVVGVLAVVLSLTTAAMAVVMAGMVLQVVGMTVVVVVVVMVLVSAIVSSLRLVLM